MAKTIKKTKTTKELHAPATKVINKALAAGKLITPKAVKAVKLGEVKKAPEPVANASPFEIETDAYFPPRMRSGKVSVYPFASLAIGQSFFISSAVDASIYKDPTEVAKAQREESMRVANRMAGATRRFTKRNEGFKFSVRTLVDPEKGEGIRVKRVEIA